VSKAFTREDDQQDPAPAPKPASPLPPGAKNYVTPDGAKMLKARLDTLLEEARRAPGEQADALNERIHELKRALESAVVVPPPSGDVDVVRFGATVSVRTLPDGDTVRYRIVGVDETDVARGWISWVSPIAKALLAAGVGDRVRAALPSGERELEILEIVYETGAPEG
jgi:transcription elongation factor GreB